MTPSAGAAGWAPPAKPPGGRPFATYLCAGLLGLLAADYLAGVLLLSVVHAEPRSATPLTLIRYAYYYGGRPGVRARILLSSGAAFGLVALASAPLWWPARRALHGAARFATRAEVRAAGLLGEEGIILGQLGRRIVMLPGQQGVALAAPPRAGKGTGVVIPNALNWPGSLVCIDIKRENWTITAGYRARCGQACYLFDPFATDGFTARWNPLTYVSEDPRRRVNDLQRIAEMLYPDPPNVDPFWTASARSLFLGIALYLFETPALPKTLGEILRQGMASDAEGFGHHWKRIIEGRNSGQRPLSTECVRALYDVIDLAPVTASSIRKTFTSRLDLFLNPILDAATAESDFDLRELRAKPMSIYVAVNPDDLHRLSPVLNLFFQQTIGLQTRELPEHNPRLKYQLMLLLDELAAVRRMKILAEAAPYLPGYNVRLVLVFHTPAQLREEYGVHNAETMLKAVAARIVFAAKDIADAREISDELGFTTVKSTSVSSPFWELESRYRRGRSQTVSDQRRALLLPQEVKELGTEEAIVFYEGLRPIRCRKIRYFSDRRFRERLLPPPDKPSPQWVFRDTAVDEVGFSQTDSPMEGGATRTAEASAAPAAPITREATMEDIERWDELRLEDFAADFSRVKIPDHPGPLSNEELQAAVDSFLETLRER